MKKTIYQILISLSLMISPSLSSAANWLADYSFDTDVTYDDNFLMSESEQDTWIYSVKPEVSLIYLSPVAKSQLDAKIAVKRYSEFGLFDSEDPAFDWKNSYKTERSHWSIDLGYSENSQRDVAELDVGIFDANTIVSTIYVDPSVIVDVTERDQLGISYSYAERDYDDNDFSDNDNQTVGLNWQHRLNELLRTTATLSLSQYSADRVAISSNDTDYVQATIGFIYKYSEATTINGSAGYFETASRARFFPGPALLIVDTERTGTLFNLGIGYRYEKDDISINLSRGLYPSSQGVVEERDSIGVDYEHQFNGRSASGINISWHNTDHLVQERESLTLSPFYRYHLTEKLQLKTTYIFRRFDRQSTFTEVDSNRFNVGLRYSF